MSIKYLVLSDLHLGHRVNSVKNIDNNIKKFLQSYKAIVDDIDVLFIAGDVFDRLLATYSSEYLESNQCLIYLMTWCKNRNVKLRVLEGTPGHDWGQCKLISKLIEELNLELDYKYINDLEIEYINDVSVLYIPDEYKHKSSDTIKAIKKLYASNNIDQCDICIMHGAFKYQLPIDLESSFVEKEMEDLIKYFIHVGHIHTFSSKGKIIAQGSFDRLRFGEDEAKGGVVCDLKTKEWVFLENKLAMIFKTFDISNEDLEEKALLELVKDNLKTVRIGGSVRFIVNPKDKIILNELKDKVNLEGKHIMKVEVPNIKTLSIADKIVEKDTIETFSITKNNIVNLVSSELDNRDIDINVKLRAIEKLELIIKDME